VGARFELIADVHCETGESPVWLAQAKRLAFVDIPGHRLYRLDPESKALQVDAVDEDIGCIGPAKEGGFVAGLRSGIWLLDDSAVKIRQLAPNAENAATNRFNDGRVDPRGRFIAGTLDEPKAGGTAGLYRYDRRGLAKLAEGLMTSNGVAFSPDGRTMYNSDTPRFVIYRYDYNPDTGAASNRRVFVQLQPTDTDKGRPDGAAVDVEGCYWTSLYEGARIQRYSAEGKLLAEHPVPTRNPTMPAFGGPDLKTLFVTTARDKSDNSGGGVYCMRVDVAGLPTPLFDLEI
jgi:sugar lactone lactonase YvrE